MVGDVIELRGRILLAGPGLAAVDGDVAAAVVAVDHALRIVGGDPQIVIDRRAACGACGTSCRRRSDL